MAGPNIADLTKTAYPIKIDDNRENASGDYQYNANFVANADYDSEDASGDNYIVKADDVNTFAEAIMAIQRTLGVTPYGDAESVSARIANIENFLRNPTVFDERYGGVNWGTPENTWPTILSHTHVGGNNAPSKIDLTAAVTGKLPKGNMTLSASDEAPLTSEDILYTKADGRSIKYHLDTKIATTGDYTIEGNFTFKGNVVGHIFAEYNMANAPASAWATTSQCSAAVDTKAYSGYSLKASQANGTCTVSVPVRFGWMSINLRCKISQSDLATAGNKLTVAISDYGRPAVSTTLTDASFENSDVYQNFAFNFEHTNSTTAPNNKNMFVNITFHTTGVSIDSMIVMPSSIGLWAENA